jgi:nitroimidazol reductase NimA-like FMN-containing flavoprotein (pyridoxamine 5'-phosphate oxidase superfamily)
MPLPRELALDPEQIEEIMTSEWNLRIATHSPEGRINLTPMWFGWAGGRIYIYGRGQKVANLRRNPQCTVIVDRNTKFPELQGLMFQGRATVLEDAAAEKADPHLEEVRVQMGRKYNGGHGRAPVEDPPPNDASAAGRHRRWIVVEPERSVTWDNFKLGRLKRRS